MPIDIYLYTFVLPPGAFFFFGIRKGLFISIGVFILSLLTMAFPSLYLRPITTGSILSYTILYAIVSLFGVVYERRLRLCEKKSTQEQKHQERLMNQLIKAKDRAEKLFSWVPSAIFTVDAKNFITSFNQKAEEITGYDASQLLLKLNTLWVDEFGNELSNQATGLDTDSIINHECFIRCIDGTVKTVLKNTQPIFNEKNEKIGRIESFVDITRQKEIEIELRNAKQRAEEASSKAIEASIAKSAFLANMSHEIRTPMNGIIGMNTLLLETKLDDEQKEYGENIKISAEALLAIINDILDFSKIEAGKLELEIIDFDLRTTLERALELVAYKALEKNIELISFIHSQVSNRLKGDPGRLRQIIINLVNNSIKFTSTGEVVLSVEQREESPDEVLLYFSIRDTGIGISEEGKKLLFKSFSQVDSSTTRKFGGTGLGLAISKKLTELMNGEIGVESVVGEGSTFWFTARFGKQLDAPAQPEKTIDLDNTRILVVEPNRTSQSVINHYLTAFHCDCTCVETSRDALFKLRVDPDSQKPFQIIIINMQLSWISGIQLATLIRSDRRFDKLRIIIITDIGKRGDAARLTKLGVNGYLTKPLKESQLRDCLSLVLTRSASHPAESDDNPYLSPLITQHTIAESKNRSRLRILMAEDNLVNQKVAIKLLEKVGYSCDIANNGMEAVNAHIKNQYDLILMDCQMPILSGYDATRAIRDEEQKKANEFRVPIIALTANAMKGDKEKCIDAGMDDYLSKPLNLKEILSVIEKWSQKKS